MKIKNRTLASLIAFLPLLIVETIIFAFDYFDNANPRANVNLCLIFGLIALMIICGKFFFDFIVTLIVNKSTKSPLGAGETAQTLISMMPLQWMVMIVPIVLMILGIEMATLVITGLLALAHVVYYIAVGISFYRTTAKKSYIVTYVAMILITLVSTFVTN